MARRFKVLGREVLIGKRLFGLGRDDEYFGMVDQGYNTKSTKNLDTYRGLVYSCINIISESVASYEPVISRRDSKGQLKALETHPMLDLLNNPGGKDDKALPITLFKLLYATQAFIEMQGDVYWYLAKGVTSGKPREIVIIRGDRMGRELDENGDIKRFFVRLGGGRRLYLEIDEVLPFVGFDPKNPYQGVSTVDAAMDYIETDHFSTIFTKNFFKNNAGVSGIIELAGEISKGAFQKFVRAWRSKHEGVDNAGKTAILRSSEAKFTKIGLGLNELDMSAIREMSMDDIMMMFRVPAALLGKIKEGVGLGRGNIETLEYIFSKYNIEPKMKQFDGVLQFALQRYYGGEGLVFGHKNIIPEDKEYLLKERVEGVDKWITRNEIRQAEGKENVKGGDQLFVPMANLPIDDAGVPAEPAKSITIKRIIKDAVAPRRVTVTAKKKDLNITPKKKESFRLRLMRTQLAYERKYIKQLETILKDQRREALDNLEAHASSLKAYNQKLFDDAAADKLMKEALKPVMHNLADQQGSLALMFAGDDSDEFKLTVDLQGILQRTTAKMATKFNDDTLAALNKTLGEGIAEGEALGKLKSRVEDVYKGAEGYRAERVARTETLKASNSATTTAYKQTGYVSGKQWYVNPDACPQCEEFDGKTVGLDDAFLGMGESYTVPGEDGEEQTITNDYETIEEPPLHPNCRCTIIPVR